MGVIKKRTINYINKVLEQLDDIQDMVEANLEKDDDNISKDWYLLQVHNAKLSLENMIVYGDK